MQERRSHSRCRKLGSRSANADTQGRTPAVAVELVIARSALPSFPRRLALGILQCSQLKKRQRPAPPETRVVTTADFGDVIAERMLVEHEGLAARWFERLVDLLPVDERNVFPSNSL